MKIRIRYNHWLPRFLGVNAITLYPFILISHSKAIATQAHIINHEWIHINQIREYGVFEFYVSYIGEYLKNLYKYRSHMIAYNKISFEIEAYKHMFDYELPEEALECLHNQQ